MIPVFDKKKSLRAGRPVDGPNGAARRRIGLTHQCLQAVLQGWNALTDKVKVLQWADGLWRRTRIFLAGLFSDQPEGDTYCCDSAQSCKLCNCPKDKLHECVEHSPKYAYSQELKVLAAANGRLDRAAGPLFNRNGFEWTPTCTKAAYERQRKALNGTHIMPNALWGVRAFDVQQMVCICMYMHVYACICMYLNVYVCICMYLLVYACICMYLHVYVSIVYDGMCLCRHTRTPCMPTITVFLCISIMPSSRPSISWRSIWECRGTA